MSLDEGLGEGLDERSFDAGIEAFRRATARDADGRATRARVLAAAARSARHGAWRRRATLALALGLAAVLSGSAAWTAAGRWRAMHAAEMVVSPGLLEPPAPHAPRADDDHPRPKPVQGPSSLRLRVAARALAATAKDVASDGEARAYGRAHAAHFEADDPQRALALWDAYLRDFPAGAFVPEARFNRALCLLRLGRREAARDALQAIAAGSHGGYRAREAQSLLDWTATPPLREIGE